MSASVLVFRNVTIQYDPTGPPIIDGISLAVDSGSRVALCGLNGSGKTTLLTAAAGLVPHRGEILINGERLTKKTLSKLRERIGFLFNVPEDQLLFPSAVEDAAFGLLRKGVPLPEAEKRARLALAALGVEHLADVPLHHLSHGQKQRVALSGALVTEPSLLLLDEPSAGLDPPGKRALADILCRLDAAVMVATHDLEFAERCCTRFVTLDRAKIVLDEKDTAEIRRRWAS